MQNCRKCYASAPFSVSLFCLQEAFFGYVDKWLVEVAKDPVDGHTALKALELQRMPDGSIDFVVDVIRYMD